MHVDTRGELSASESSIQSCGLSQNAAPLLEHSFHQRGRPGELAHIIPQYTSPRLQLVAYSVKWRTFKPRRSENPTASVDQFASGIHRSLHQTEIGDTCSNALPISHQKTPVPSPLQNHGEGTGRGVSDGQNRLFFEPFPKVHDKVIQLFFRPSRILLGQQKCIAFR